jgi:nicotinate dehydrogenase subunit A
MASSVALNVNGQAVTVTVDDPAIPLLYVLRENLELRGPRFGCGLAQCGACMVLLDNEAVLSCDIKLSAVGDRKIVTLEGLGSPERPSPVQQAFIDEQAVQCGYCLNGVIIQTVALLAKNKNPSEAEIKTALADNLCRCGTHLRMIRAVQRAARNA